MQKQWRTFESLIEFENRVAHNKHLLGTTCYLLVERKSEPVQIEVYMFKCMKNIEMKQWEFQWKRN